MRRRFSDFGKYKYVSDKDPDFDSEPANMKLDLIPRFFAQEFDLLENDKLKRGETPVKIRYNGQEVFLDQKLSKITFGEVSYFKRDNVGGKTRWFRFDNTERMRPEATICIAHGIEFNAQKYFLQALLVQMDNKLHKSFEDFLNQEHGALNTGVVKDYERKSHANLLVYPVVKSTGTKCDPLYLSGGRSVFYVTVGQMKHTKIIIKQHEKAQIRTEESDSLNGEFTKKILSKLRSKVDEPSDNQVSLPTKKLKISDRIHHRHPRNLFKKRFVDKAHAVAYAQQHIHCFKVDKENKPDDPDFDLQEEEDPVVISQVMDCLVVLAKTAKECKAAILVPDYLTMSPNSKLIETALDHVEFDGPVINVCTEGQAACDEQSADEVYHVKDNINAFPKGLLLNRATHSIQVQHGSYSRVAARLATVIAQPDRQLFGSDGQPKKSSTSDPPSKVIFVVAGGGAVVMEHIAEAVEQSIPIVVLHGSKRLCDYLPKVWVNRFSSQFDVLDQTRRLCADCGFAAPTDPDNKMNLWMRTIVEKGHLNIHPLPSGTHSLSRILQSLQSKDDALLQAMRRYCDYRCAARGMEVPDFWMLIAKLVLGFATTLSVTIAAAVLEPGQLQEILHGKVELSKVPVPILVLCLSVIVLPAVLSIIMALQHDYNYAPKILALRYAAALVEQEMFRYRACSKYYSDEQISKAIKSAKKGSEGAGTDVKESTQESSTGVQKDAAEENLDGDEHVQYDMQSTRARRLTEELIKIGEKVPVFDRPDVDAEEKYLTSEFIRLFRLGKKKTPKTAKDLTARLDIHVLVEKLKTLSGVKEVAHHTLHDFESENNFGQLSGEDYARVRLDVYREIYEGQADDLDWLLLFYKVATYAIGAVSSFLSYMGLETWVTVSTALLSAFAAYNAYSPMEQRVQSSSRTPNLKLQNDNAWQMLRAAVFALEDIQTQWTAVPSELKIQQQYKDLLMENTEKVLLSVHKMPPDFTRAGDSANHIFPDRKKKAIEDKDSKSADGNGGDNKGNGAGNDAAASTNNGPANAAPPATTVATPTASGTGTSPGQ